MVASAISKTLVTTYHDIETYETTVLSICATHLTLFDLITTILLEALHVIKNAVWLFSSENTRFLRQRGRKPKNVGTWEVEREEGNKVKKKKRNKMEKIEVKKEERKWRQKEKKGNKDEEINKEKRRKARKEKERNIQYIP